ncbi:CDP-diacylglycerol--serine O-phosphatidyltransferase [Paenibacillus marchantiophytorum]|uniref:CDP-diacylglycerol--serine O-phosphatidyltransferase n=2 Tax=Paenibacillus TaxID=44249 RepID=A0A1V4HCB4_9BACL|nr:MULTISPECIES: CDP-diacylglycerol--serine O-phosphatidyltransferase [Paenibacillus]OPH50546.1 CDP-diacylglycerol--serine O-phosphatidyltransferase [Paenibacillus ferrarius]GGI44963.1 CDP-diacylglycerol--serine O-phosphatidyltransferase [Paenibacillus marchantiophytorum]
MSVQTIPTLLKMAVLSGGMMSMFFSFHDKPSQAVLCIVLAAVLAGFDEYIVSRLNLATEFGKEFRSLAELISFGAAPALIVYLISLHKLPVSGLLLASLFIICGALRLARFNIATCVHRHHTGLPIHIAGCLLAVLTLWSPILNHMELTVILVIALCGLMVSRIKIPKISKPHLIHKKSF